ncbi:PREDICTED: mucin-19-like [Priapulus caudatus]|uniref:Mucin-19-like n=1 Tax=Priapulus caudatus TaxID=37621 RepID=A0ABM1EN45_PRICU|nr:PREDICTED: mucin-19-like [Priapulus caudatus]
MENPASTIVFSDLIFWKHALPNIDAEIAFNGISANSETSSVAAACDEPAVVAMVTSSFSATAAPENPSVSELAAHGSRLRCDEEFADRLTSSAESELTVKPWRQNESIDHSYSDTKEYSCADRTSNRADRKPTDHHRAILCGNELLLEFTASVTAASVLGINGSIEDGQACAEIQRLSGHNAAVTELSPACEQEKRFLLGTWVHRSVNEHFTSAIVDEVQSARLSLRNLRISAADSAQHSSETSSRGAGGDGNLREPCGEFRERRNCGISPEIAADQRDPPSIAAHVLTMSADGNNDTKLSVDCRTNGDGDVAATTTVGQESCGRAEPVSSLPTSHARRVISSGSDGGGARRDYKVRASAGESCRASAEPADTDSGSCVVRECGLLGLTGDTGASSTLTRDTGVSSTLKGDTGISSTLTRDTVDAGVLPGLKGDAEEKAGCVAPDTARCDSDVTSARETTSTEPISGECLLINAFAAMKIKEEEDGYRTTSDLGKSETTALKSRSGDENKYRVSTRNGNNASHLSEQIQNEINTNSVAATGECETGRDAIERVLNKDAAEHANGCADQVRTVDENTPGCIAPNNVGTVPDDVGVVPDDARAVPNNAGAVPDDVGAVPDDAGAVRATGEEGRERPRGGRDGDAPGDTARDSIDHASLKFSTCSNDSQASDTGGEGGGYGSAIPYRILPASSPDDSCLSFPSSTSISPCDDVFFTPGVQTPETEFPHAVLAATTGGATCCADALVTAPAGTADGVQSEMSPANDVVPLALLNGGSPTVGEAALPAEVNSVLPTVGEAALPAEVNSRSQTVGEGAPPVLGSPTKGVRVTDLDSVQLPLPLDSKRRPLEQPTSREHGATQRPLEPSWGDGDQRPLEPSWGDGDQRPLEPSWGDGDQRPLERSASLEDMSASVSARAVHGDDGARSRGDNGGGARKPIFSITPTRPQTLSRFTTVPAKRRERGSEAAAAVAPPSDVRLARTLSLDKATIEERVVTPNYVPEKLDFKQLEKFEGQMLLNWLCSSFSDDHYVCSALNRQELRLIAAQFCTHLMAAGILHALEGQQQSTIFRPDVMYTWTRSAQLADIGGGPVPRKLTIEGMWPPPVPYAPSQTSLRYSEAEHQNVVMELKKDHAHAMEQLQKEQGVSLFARQTEFASSRCEYENQLAALELELEKYKILAGIENLREEKSLDEAISNLHTGVGVKAKVASLTENGHATPIPEEAHHHLLPLPLLH